MKNVLVIGSTGQIGSELTMKLRGIYGGNIVAGYIPGQEPKGELVWAVCLTYWKLHVKCIVLYSLRVQSVCLAITRRKTRLRRIRSVTRVLCTVLRKFQASC